MGIAYAHVLDKYPNGVGDLDNCSLKKEVRRSIQELVAKRIYWQDQGFPQRLKILDTEFDVLDMMASCYTYHGISYGRLNKFDKYYSDYLRKYKEVGGKQEDLDKLISVQTSYLSKCRIIRNVDRDSDGLTYNAIEYVQGSEGTLDIYAQPKGLNIADPDEEMEK